MRYSWKIRDFLKGLIIGVGTPVLYVIQEMIPNWPLNPIQKAALSATITYLVKNYFTDDLKAAQKVIKEDEDATKKDEALSSAGPGGSTLPPPGGLPPKP